MSSQYILNIDEVNKENIQLVGGKGANLGELISNGYPVPAGFCISVEAYKSFIEYYSLQERIDQIISEIDWDNPNDIEQKSSLIRSFILEKELLGEIENEVIEAYLALENKSANEAYVAVRSSATAEDLPDASFAGQQETFLYVKGENELIQYIKSCWASLWSARAVAYRHKNTFDHQKVLISVVIQKMINAEVSGIIFTNNPLTMNEKEMLITSSYGLGELVVSGQVTPDSFIINKSNMNVIKRELGSKEKELVMGTHDRTMLLDLPENKQNSYSLTDKQLRELCELAIQVENHYKFPQDIEWSFADGKLYLLQSRPITTIRRSGEGQLGNLSRTQIKILDDLLEHYPDAPSPLDYSVVTLSYQSLLDRAEDLGISFSKATEIIQFDTEGNITLNPPKIKLKWSILLLPFKLLKAAKIKDEQWLDIEQEFNTFLEKMKGLEIMNLSNEQLLKELDNIFVFAEKINQIRFQYIVDSTMMPIITFSIITKLFSNKNDSLFTSDIITTNLNYKTSIIDKKLFELAMNICKFPEIKSIVLERKYCNYNDFLTDLLATPAGEQILAEIENFLNNYGYRTEKMYQPFISKSWLDDKLYFLDILKAVINDPQLFDRKRKEEERNNKYQEWLLKFESKLKGPIKKLFTKNYTRLRKIYIYREETVFFIETIFHFGRRITSELAVRLKNEGFLENSNDIIFIQREELTEVFEMTDKKKFAQILRARKEHAKHNQLIWKQYIIQLSKKTIGASKEIKGISGSNGLAEGPVKIITKVEDFKKLEQGDILVCQYTDPAWTPLFGIATAVVSDTGGPLSHAAIVAREYEIPAVLGTKIGTSSLKDGDIVVVDGTEGTVHKK